jgi:cell division protein FtsB
MNVYKPTGEKVENWPQWVQRLSNENIVLKRRIAELEKQNEELAEETLQLKSRCCDIWKQLTEEQARNAK